MSNMRNFIKRSHRLNEADFELIRELYEAGKSQREAARMLGCSAWTIVYHEAKLGLVRIKHNRIAAQEDNKKQAAAYKAKKGKTHTPR